MARALFHAARGRGRTAPNPMVGAVVVSHDGVVVGQGHHEQAGLPHAEVNALNEAGTRARGSTLYCTLEPCSHSGRTGPCVERIAAAGIARVVAAVQDPYPLVSGRGFAYLRERGIAVDVGVGAADATALNQPFFTWVRDRRPFVVLKAALSRDGYLSDAPGRRTILTSAAANRHAHQVRAEVDAIAVGSGTVLADDPQLTPRGPYRVRPLTRVVFDRRLRTPPAARLLSTRESGPVMIITTAQAAARAELRCPLEERGAEVVVAGDGTLAAGLRLLGSRGVASLLLEGGGGIHAAAWDEGLIDFVRLYMTPRTLGPGGVTFLPDRGFDPDRLGQPRRISLGPDVLVEGYVHGPR